MNLGLRVFVYLTPIKGSKNKNKWKEKKVYVQKNKLLTQQKDDQPNRRKDLRTIPLLRG